MRVDLAGKGDPIPRVALPDASVGDTPPQVFPLADGVPFLKADWVSLGYTDFEVWCVGASGGKGADDSLGVSGWRSHDETVQAPPDIWELVLQSFDHAASASGETYYIYNGQQVTPRQLAELQNPNHLLTRTTWTLAGIDDQPVTGGGGGGGGLHYVSGILAELPDSVPVVVGHAGADATPSQVQENGPVTYLPWTSAVAPPNSPQQEIDYINNVLNPLGAWSNVYLDPPVVLDVPQPGEDGGASSFGDIGMASGGKGGRPHTVWENGVKVQDAAGGEGGTGGSTVAGGGAAGGVPAVWDGAMGDNAVGVPGQDGSWDGAIGQGGGGGAGGRYIRSTSSDLPVTTIQASAGGRGSFSYFDTTVYGVGQDRRPFVVAQGTTPVVIPGTGGGARLKGQGYGSKAPSYSPDGVVYLRISKID